MFRIGTITIKNPSNFKIERYNVTNMERRADAYMVGDLIAKKLKYYFTYDVISGSDLDTILEAIWEPNELFFDLTYTYNGIEKTDEVYVGSIPTELHKAGLTSNWVWKNVTFNLIGR